jgi:outer membrane protein TolC
MFNRTILFLLLCSKLTLSQFSLDHFIKIAMDNSPVIKEYQHEQTINHIQQKINAAENSASHVSLSSTYLFTPYFHNHGDLITTHPSPQAIGYDINLFDGGLYSAQLNLERNILNGQVLNVLDRQIKIQDDNYQYDLDLEKHNLHKEITDQYLKTYQSLLLARVSNEVVTNLTQQLKLTGELAEKGFAKTQDYLLQRIELKNQCLALADARQVYKSSLYQLYALCGIQDTTVVEIDSVAIEMTGLTPDSYFMQKYKLDSLTTITQQKLFETKYLPQVNLFVNTGLNAVEIKNMQRKFGMSAGLSLSLPLFDGRQKSLTRQQSRIQQQKIGEYRRFARRNIAIQRKDLQSRIHGLQQSIQILSEQVNDYKKLLHLSESQLQQGTISMLDHLILLRNFIDLRKNKIEMEINCLLEINNYNYWNW